MTQEEKRKPTQTYESASIVFTCGGNVTLPGMQTLTGQNSGTPPSSLAGSDIWREILPLQPRCAAEYHVRIAIYTGRE